MKKLLIGCLISQAPFLYAAEEDTSTDTTWSDSLNIGGAFVTWKYEASGETYAPISFEAILDYKAFEPLEVSLRLGMGFGEDEQKVSGSTTSAELDFYKMLYLKPYVSWEGVRLYGLVGYGDYDIKSSSNVGASGVSYGIGSDYNLFDVATVFLEWRRLPKTGGDKLSSIGMGFILPY